MQVKHTRSRVNLMTADGTQAAGVRLLGNRVLEGPNLYFPRPAIKTTIDVSGWLSSEPDQLSEAFALLRARRPRLGDEGSAVRDRAVMRLVEVVTRRVAAASGTGQLGVRVRHGEEPSEYVVAFPWKHLERGRALGRAVAAALADLLDPVSSSDAVRRAADAVLASEPGPAGTMSKPKVPVISITGTNGKTTTTRLVSHISMTAGRKTAWSSTDGVLVMGEHVERGDYSGPSGARTVLATPGLEVAVLETARGGLLNRGMGVPYNDVSVVTNVSPDHLGTGGIDTVDQLAEVKAIITKVTRPSGWCVLNGDDPRVWAMRVGTPAQIITFTLDPEAPCIREARAAHGKAFTVIDNDIVCIDDSGVDSLVSLDDVPMTMAGLSAHNIANALAGAAGALALGLPRSAVVEGLRTFSPDANLNPGRMNVYTVPKPSSPDESITVIIDMAHNEGGLEALLAVGRGLVAPGGRLLLGLGTGGDRSDEILANLGELAGRGADLVHVVHKEHYLRGRSMENLESHFRDGLARVGVSPEASHRTELDGVQSLLDAAHGGDVVAVMTHSHQADIHSWLTETGASMDDARTIARKARTARGVPNEEIESTGLPDDVQGHIGDAVASLRRVTASGHAPAALVDALDLLTSLPHRES
ncbi:hypothetical protein GCM10009763_02670 [Dermacoccus profundi]|uniref:Mur ligase n=2 Tax=Dermacoccaceae TaxID=145357 RepID=A0ABN2CED8_9MICO